MTDNEIKEIQNQMNDIDEIVDRKSKLSIFTFLSGVDEIEFLGVAKATRARRGQPGRDLAALSQAGLVSISRKYSGFRVGSWAHLPSQGHVSLDLDLHYLQSIIDTVRRSRRISDDPPPRNVGQLSHR
ncbi:hypothetical protein ACFVX3_33060 [Rhodococcus erythropolis]